MGLPTTASGWARCLLSSFVCGIALASFVPEKFILPLVCLVFVGVFFLRKWQHIITFVLVMFVVVSFGVLRYQIAIPDTGVGSVVSFISQEVTVEGVVSDEVSTSSQSQNLTLDQVLVNGKEARYKIIARVPRYPEVQYGDRLRMSCTLEAPEPFDGFRYDRYLAKDGILAICQTYQEPFLLEGASVGWRGGLMKSKTAILERIAQTFHEPYASLLGGLLLGEKQLPDSIQEDFRRVGLSHIVAASGQNVVLVTELLFWMLIGIGLCRKKASWLLLVGIVLYVLLAGADAAIVRAGIMGSVVVMSKAIGRIPSSANLLLFALSLMLMVNPMLLRDDVGFQLSFAATAGLVVLQPKLGRFFFFIPKTFGLREALATSTAAIVATLPVILMSFGELSFVAPLANLLVLPLIPFVMIGGAVILLISAVFQTAALFLSAPVVGGLKVMLGFSHLFSSIPFAGVDFGSLTWLRIFLCLLSLWFLKSLFSLRSTSVQQGFELSWKYFVAVGVLLLIPVVPNLFQRREFSTTFFSVGQGDATFLQFASGERWLIDGGPDDTVLTKLGQVLPWYDRRIDVMVPTHADADHITGLIEVARRYQIGHVYLATDDSNVRMQTLQRALLGVQETTVRAGDQLREGEVEVTVFGPTESEVQAVDRNDRSVVLLLDVVGKKILLTGDASAERERRFAKELPQVDIYKAGHHGSYTSSSYELLSHIQPKIAVISCGVDNRYGHPHGVVLKRLEAVGASLFRTDLEGDIQVVIAGDEFKVTRDTLWY